VRGDLDKIFSSIRAWSAKKGDHSLVDAGGCVLVKHISQAGTSVFERLAQLDKLCGDECGLWTAQAHNPDAPSPRWRGDGGDGVDGGVGGSSQFNRKYGARRLKKLRRRA
jgi:hypothetical protein